MDSFLPAPRVQGEWSLGAAHSHSQLLPYTHHQGHCLLPPLWQGARTVPPRNNVLAGKTHTERRGISQVLRDTQLSEKRHS